MFLGLKMAVRSFVCVVFLAIDSTLENCVFSIQFVRIYTVFSISSRLRFVQHLLGFGACSARVSPFRPCWVKQGHT